MTGDGVNDILALKAANTSISFNSATDAAKELSDFVLLDDSFENIPHVVKEGRRIISNITRTSILFLTKTILILLLVLFTIPTKQAITVLSLENLNIFEVFIIAIAGFFLSVENSKVPIKSTFKEAVYPKAIASGLLCALSGILGILVYNSGMLGPVGNEITMQVEQSLITILITLSGSAVLLLLCYPFTAYRMFVVIFSLAGCMIGFLAYPNMFLNVNSSGLTIQELFNILIHPFNFENSIFVYFTKEAYIVIIFFILLVIPCYVFTINIINFILNKRFLRKIELYQEEFSQKMKNILKKKK